MAGVIRPKKLRGEKKGVACRLQFFFSFSFFLAKITFCAASDFASFLFVCVFKESQKEEKRDKKVQGTIFKII